jgi:hypothetical protein
MISRSHKFLFVAIVLLIIGVVFYYNPPQVRIPSESLDYIEYEITHPFSIENTNLLKEPAEDAKRKSRLNKYDITHALDEILLSEGLKNEKSSINRYNLNIPLSAYDMESRIGYILIDYDRLGPGLLANKLSKGLTLEQGKIEFLKMIDQGIELYFDDNEKFLDEVFGKKKKEGVDQELSYEEVRTKAWFKYQEDIKSNKDNKLAYKEYRATVNEISHLIVPYNRLIKDWDYFGAKIKPRNEILTAYGEEVRAQLMSFDTYSDQRDYLEALLPEVRKKLEIDYLSSKSEKTMFDEWKLSAADMIEESERFFGLVSMIDNIRLYSPTAELSDALNAHIFEIIAESDRKSWWKHSNAIFDLFNANKHPGLYSKNSYKNLLTDILTRSEYTTWENRYQEINDIGEYENISLEELKSLDALAIQKGIFIAPISILDDRMIYDMKEQQYLDSLDLIRKEINNSKSKEERKKLQEQLMSLSEYRSENYNEIRNKAKAKSIVRLQSDMCKYIEWAKNLPTKKDSA